MHTHAHTPKLDRYLLQVEEKKPKMQHANLKTSYSNNNNQYEFEC